MFADVGITFDTDDQILNIHTVDVFAPRLSDAEERRRALFQAMCFVVGHQAATRLLSSNSFAPASFLS
jgi:hypothetical protein